MFRTSATAALGLKLIAHPEKPGTFIVSELAAEQSAAQHGVRVGDHIRAINGTEPTSLRHAQSLLSAEWSGSKALKLSLADATRDIFIIGRPPTGIGVELISFKGSQSPPNPSQPRFGVVVKAVKPGSLAAAAGLERLQVIYSVNGKLATAAGALTAEMISQRGLSGVATLVISEHKVPDSVELAQVQTGEVAVSVVHSL